MKKILVLFALAISCISAYTQHNDIAQFAIWIPKEGQVDKFEAGYKRHLEWHKNNGDTWGWWGWFIVSGPRYGYFVDATFSRSWQDFDRAVKPAGDMADNRKNVFPHGNVHSIFKAKHITECSTTDSFDNKLKICRMLRITVNNLHAAQKLIGHLRDHYASKDIPSFQTYRIIDGSELNQFVILAGFKSWEEFGRTEDLSDQLEQLQESMKTNCIISTTSETMVYRPDLSWFPSN